MNKDNSKTDNDKVYKIKSNKKSDDTNNINNNKSKIPINIYF